MRASSPPRLWLGICFLLLFTCAGCTGDERPVTVNLQDRQPLPARMPAGKPLTVCIGSMITPQDGYGYYRQLLDYLAAKLGRRVQAIDPGNYREVNELLENAEADAAFVCGGPYVDGRDRFGLELLVAPVVNGEAVYYSYLIVPAASAARSLADLRGGTFAFTDPQSNSGLLVPVMELADRGERPETFFRSFVFTYAHDRSIHAVAGRMVDGAAVDSLVWDFLAATEPELTAKTRIIARYGPYGMPPVVANPRLDPALREQLKKILLTLHLDPQGRQILEGMRIERFVEVADADYDSIRRLLNRYQHVSPVQAERRR